MTLVEFLRARLDEDQAIAQSLDDVEDRTCGVEVRETDGYPSERILRIGKVQLLAQVEAKRRIVDEIARADPHSAYITGTFTAWDVLALLAQPYSDHPDYDPAWRPDVT